MNGYSHRARAFCSEVFSASASDPPISSLNHTAQTCIPILTALLSVQVLGSRRRGEFEYRGRDSEGEGENIFGRAASWIVHILVLHAVDWRRSAAVSTMRWALAPGWVDWIELVCLAINHS